MSLWCSMFRRKLPYLFRRRSFCLAFLLVLASFFLFCISSGYFSSKSSEVKHHFKEGLKAQMRNFTLDGEPFKILSGSIHYFRVPKEYWKDRLLKLRACGLNTVDTYIPWNLHEPEVGIFEFEDNLDVVKYIKLAGSLGLYVIVRPGPYVCSELDWGGLPAWLLADQSMVVRSMYSGFIDAVEKYFNILMPQLAPLTHANGGPIIALQVENEYGAYGTDKNYLRWLRKQIYQYDIKEFLFTSNNVQDTERGSLPSMFTALTYDKNATMHFERLLQLRPDQPLFAGEFWPGWFDHWGDTNNVVSVEEYRQRLSETLEIGASVNLYMFHGGTNFGFINGANRIHHYGKENYRPAVTSYDYGAPISESGQLTQKWFATRYLLRKYKLNSHLKFSVNDYLSVTSTSYGLQNVQEHLELTTLLDQISGPTIPHPEYMETYCQYSKNNCRPQSFGFIAYRRSVNGQDGTTLKLKGYIFDRALLVVNGQTLYTLEPEISRTKWVNTSQSRELPIILTNLNAANDVIILVENMGRVNYDTFPNRLDDQRKGFSGHVYQDDKELTNWEVINLDFHPFRFWKTQYVNLIGWKQFSAVANHKQPALYRTKFHIVGKPQDTYLNTQSAWGWVKGIAFINQLNLGRYWNIGPQHSLYCPGTKLRKGLNELILFELHAPRDQVSFEAKTNLGDSEHDKSKHDTDTNVYYHQSNM